MLQKILSSLMRNKKENQNRENLIVQMRLLEIENKRSPNDRDMLNRVLKDQKIIPDPSLNSDETLSYYL